MNIKEVWIGNKQVQPGEKFTTTDGYPVKVVQVDEMSGKLMLQPDTDDPELYEKINQQLSSFELPARIGAEMWARVL